MSIHTPSQLTNNELTEALARLARSGRETTVGLVNHLAEFEARDLHLAAGFDSLFAYCTEVLRLSEHEAYHRILAARTARKHPRILRMLGDGTLNLTTVRLIAPHLTDESADGLLDAAAGRSKRQVEELVARHAPRPDVPSSARKPPAHVKRAASRRDAGRCAFVGTNGRRCETRAFLEFHHVIPYAMGGEATVENIELRCRAHNGYEAGLFYGQGEHWDGGGGEQLGPDRVRAGSKRHPSAPA